ncbi:MAG: hypothetical protein E6I76_04565 [Chloroflexi bacterium]|nr:MAG: hypothetical protein E6I76_04565 [Chloroflexota bacterium]
MPSQVWLVAVFATIVIGGLFGTVIPLITTGGAARAEVSGQLPQQLEAGQAIEQPLALDNTSGGVIKRTCLLVELDPAGVVDIPEVRFQGLDVEQVSGGQACGGQLSGQEVISLRARLVALRPGTVRVRLLAGDRGRPIGPPLSRTVTVVAAPAR